MSTYSIGTLWSAARTGAIICLIFSFVVIIYPVPSAHSDGGSQVQSNDVSVIQIGDWETVEAAGASGGSYLQNTSTNAALLIEFVGPGIEIVYVTGPDYDPIALEIDGTVLRTVLTKTDEAEFGHSAVITYLSDAPHRLKVYGPMVGHVAVDAFFVLPTRLTPPARPSGLIVNDMDWREEGFSVALTWSDNSDNEYGFVVYISRFVDWEWQGWESLTVTGSDVTGLEVTVPYDEVWCVSVSAFRHGIGRSVESGLSNPVCLIGFGGLILY